MKVLLTVILLPFCFMSVTSAETQSVSSPTQLAYLCGSDEDGCQSSDPSSCSCVLQTSSHSSRFCLHFNADNSMTCRPNPENKKCEKGEFNEESEQECVNDALQAGSTCPKIELSSCFYSSGKPKYLLQDIKHLI